MHRLNLYYKIAAVSENINYSLAYEKSIFIKLDILSEIIF